MPQEEALLKFLPAVNCKIKVFVPEWTTAHLCRISKQQGSFIHTSTQYVPSYRDFYKGPWFLETALYSACLARENLKTHYERLALVVNGFSEVPVILSWLRNKVSSALRIYVHSTLNANGSL